jgi:hypothetical protein
VSLWTDLGFRENPYSTRSIPPTEEGAHLLVGRDPELKRMLRLISSSETHPTVEGDNGVGKTSLVQVAGYLAKKQHADGREPQLFVPLDGIFQLTHGEELESFRRRVYYGLARAFATNRDVLTAAGLATPDFGAVEKWLQSPLFHGKAVATPFGGGEWTTTPNETAGFTEDGFIATVNQWLVECFPSLQAGAFVCVLDNLELLETSQAARRAMEAMRDLLLNVRGLRWVLCGARGIVRSGASSPRLHGVLASPMEVGPISDQDVGEVMMRRIESFALTPDAYAPVDGRGFQHVYHVLNGNLRDAFKHCEDFAMWMDDQGEQPADSDDRYQLLEVWLSEQAKAYNRDARNVKARAWEVFDTLASPAIGGSCSPSDNEQFGFNTSMAMRPHIKDLEEAGLVVSSKGDKDQRRKTISLTSSGWLVRYERSGYEEPPRA